LERIVNSGNALLRYCWRGAKGEMSDVTSSYGRTLNDSDKIIGGYNNII
jgi:hypothetical protein